MLIKKSRIRSVPANLKSVLGSSVRFGVFLDDIDPGTAAAAGLDPSAVAGTSVLPGTASGSVSRFNAYGKWIVHKDRPKETRTRQRLWEWTELHGRTKVPRSRIIDIRYQAYPRTFVSPPSVELEIATATDGRLVAVTPTLTVKPPHYDAVLHAVNLLLEMFGLCRVFDAKVNAIVTAELRRLNWHILPQGTHPWETLRPLVSSVLAATKPGNRPVVERRLEYVNGYGPSLVAVGRGGFSRYLVFCFPKKGRYVLECSAVDNATYIFGTDWEQLSQMTKGDIVAGGHHIDRVVHNRKWWAGIERHLE